MCGNIIKKLIKINALMILLLYWFQKVDNAINKNINKTFEIYLFKKLITNTLTSLFHAINFLIELKKIIDIGLINLR